MEEFKEIFGGLDEQALGNIEYILTHPAYEQYFRPYIQGMHDSMVRMWKQPFHMRSTPLTDDDLRGGARFAEGLLLYFDRLVAEARDERVLRSQGLISEPHMMARESGFIAAPPAHTGYNADEDF
jgi:hypothetical protein